jgi:large repetitive protein
VGDTFTYALVAGAGSTDNASFAISGSSLVATNPSALSAGSYSIRVRTTDVAGNSFEQTFSITVTSNQAPAVTTPTAIALTDTSTTDTLSNQTGTLSATDADGIASYGIQGGATGGSTLVGAATYDVSKLGTYGTLYVKSSDGSYVYVPNASAINGRLANTSETFTVTATDSNASAATGTATLTVNITGVNDTPTDIGLTATSVSQSGGTNATVGTLSTADADSGDTHTYTLVSGTGDTNNALFNISGTSLRATNAASMTPGTYTVRVQTTDAASATYAEAMTITVVDDVAPP